MRIMSANLRRRLPAQWLSITLRGMKKANPDANEQGSEPERAESDNLCKRLAEEHPDQFARWLFNIQSGKVKVEKTELRRAPIHADSVILSSESDILHAEFQTTKKSKVPLPLRMLDYYVGFRRQNPRRRVRQAVIVLKETRVAIPDRYEDERTSHRYDVIKMWEQDPRELMRYEGLLPLATLCRAESDEKLLAEVAARINRIKSREQRRETLNLSRVLAGVRYDKNLIYKILKESDMLEESVVYQDILQKGLQQGLQQGLQRERRLVVRLLERLIGKLSAPTRRQIEEFDADQLEELGEALVDFRSEKDLTAWIEQRAATH
jgi:predicted transposase YdaD